MIGLATRYHSQPRLHLYTIPGCRSKDLGTLSRDIHKARLRRRSLRLVALELAAVAGRSLPQALPAARRDQASVSRAENANESSQSLRLECSSGLHCPAQARLEEEPWRGSQRKLGQPGSGPS